MCHRGSRVSGLSLFFCSQGPCPPLSLATSCPPCGKLCECHFEQFLFSCTAKMLKSHDTDRYRNLTRFQRYSSMFLHTFQRKRRRKNVKNIHLRLAFEVSIVARNKNVSFCDETAHSQSTGSDGNQLPVFNCPSIPDICKCGLPSA